MLISKLFNPLKPWSHGIKKHAQEFDCVCLTILWDQVIKVIYMYMHVSFHIFFCFVMLCMDVLCILYASVLYLENFGSQCISLDTQKISPKNWAVLYQKVLFLQGRQSHFFWVKFIKMVGILNAYLWVKYNMAKEKHRVSMKKKKKKMQSYLDLTFLLNMQQLKPFYMGFKIINFNSK